MECKHEDYLIMSIIDDIACCECKCGYKWYSYNQPGMPKTFPFERVQSMQAENQALKGRIEELEKDNSYLKERLEAHKELIEAYKEKQKADEYKGKVVAEIKAEGIREAIEHTHNEVILSFSGIYHCLEAYANNLD